jgi:hypothetical protein
MESTTIYIEKGGEANTDAVVAAARQRAGQLGIKTIVIASSRGATAVKAVDVFQGMKLIVVGHEYGHVEPNATDFLDENRRIVESKGAKIVAGIHALGGIDNAFRARPGFPTGGAAPTGTPPPVPAPGTGTDEEVIAIGGSSRGADTAVVIKPANAARFFDLKIKEIICKPRG